MPPTGYLAAKLSPSDERHIRKLAEKLNTTVARLAGLFIAEGLARRREEEAVWRRAQDRADE